MLQIISGKFFTGRKISAHDGKGILYSNCSWVAAIKTEIGILEPVDYMGDVSSYVFNYKNQLEEHPVLIRTGDREIVEQFKLICSFGLGGYFSEHHEQVNKICSPIRSTGNQVSQFIHKKVELKKHLQHHEIDDFIKLTNKIISLSRAQYIYVMGALRTLLDAVDVINYNLDLGYSMLVYCLESLSQTTAYPKSSWDDWDQTSKAKLEDSLSKICDGAASEIKSILLEDKHFKLQQRFVEFAKKNISCNFFLSESSGVQCPLRAGQVEQALKNAYQMRSKFVHALQPIQDQIRHPQSGRFDVFSFNENPYLTFGGLYRLTSHVIKTFIFSLPSVVDEKINYWNELPGLMQVEMAPQYWISQEESFNGKTANRILSALLGQLETGTLTDMTKVMHKIMKIINSTSKAQRAPMFFLYWIYNFVVHESQKVVGWQDFVKKHEHHFSEFRIENITVRAVVGGDLPWPIHDSINEYKKYSLNRHKSGHLSLSSLTEVILLCTIANGAQRAGYGNEFNWLLNTALSEIPSNREVQSLIYNKMIRFEQIPMVEMFKFCRKNTKTESAS